MTLIYRELPLYETLTTSYACV